jgi:hypothetical protein
VADTPTVPPGRAAVGCALLIVATFAPVMSGLYLFSPAWVGLLIGFGAAVAANFILGVWLGRYLRLDTVTTPPGEDTPDGDDNRVHYVAFGDQHEPACPDPTPHAPHRWYYRCDMPYTVFQPDGSTVPRSAPLTGHAWCRGRPGATPR